MGAPRPPQLRLSLGDSFGGSLAQTAACDAGDDSSDESDSAPDDELAIAAAYGQSETDPSASLVEVPVQEEHEYEASEDEYDECFDDPSLPLHRQQRGATQLVLNHKRARSHFSIPDVVITADEADGGDNTYEVRLADADRRSILFPPDVQATIEEALRTGEVPSSAGGASAPVPVSFISCSSSGSITTGFPLDSSVASPSSSQPDESTQPQSGQPSRQRPGRPLIQLDRDARDPNIQALNGALSASIRGSTYAPSPGSRPVSMGSSASASPNSSATATPTNGKANTSLGESVSSRTSTPMAPSVGDPFQSPPLQLRRGSGGDVGMNEKKTKKSPLGFLLLGKKNRSNTLPSLPALPITGQDSSAPFPSLAPATSSTAPILPPLHMHNGYPTDGSPTSPEGGGFWSNLTDQPRSPSHPNLSSDETSSSLAIVSSPPLGGLRQEMPQREGSGSTLASEPSKPPSKAEKKAVEKERKARAKAEQALVKELATLDKIVKAHDAKQAKEGAKQAKALAKASRSAPLSSPDQGTDSTDMASPPLSKQKSGLSRLIFGKKAGKKDSKSLEPGLSPILQNASTPATGLSLAHPNVSPTQAGKPPPSKSRSGSLSRKLSSGMDRSSSTRRALAAFEQRHRAERGHGPGMSRSSLSASTSVRRAGPRKSPSSRAISPSRSPSHTRPGSGASSSLQGSPQASPASPRQSPLGRNVGVSRPKPQSGPVAKASEAHVKLGHATDEGWAETDWIEDDEDAGSSEDDVDRGRSLDLQRNREKAEVRAAEQQMQLEQKQAKMAPAVSSPEASGDTPKFLDEDDVDSEAPRAKSPALVRKPVPMDEQLPSPRAASSNDFASPSAPAAIPSSTESIVGPMGRLRNTAQQELDRFVFPRAPPEGARA